MLVRNREQCLHSLDVADADGQLAFVLADLGYTIGLDGLLYAEPDAVLIHIEEQQLFESSALIER